MKKIRVVTLLATTGKEALQICSHLPTTEEGNNPKETVEKLKAYFKPK